MIPPEIVQKIAQGDCVICVGAGLSIGAGLPSWPQLLEEMIRWSEQQGVSLPIEDLRKMISEGKFPKVANSIIRTIGREQFREFLDSLFSIPNIHPTEAHSILPSIPFSSVLTTNYDKLIESAYALHGKNKPISVFTHANAEELGAVLSSNEFHIVKTHGDIDDIDSIVLSLDDYQNLMHGNEAYKLYLQHVFTSKTVLFIGFSLNDPDLTSILDGLRVHLKKITPPHYALIEEGQISQTEAQELLDTYNVNVIRYKPSSPSHPEIPHFLKDLAERIPKKHLRQMESLKKGLDSIDTHYRIVASTDEKYEIFEKFPGASKERPLVTSFTLAGDSEVAESIQRFIDTGEQITLHSDVIRDVKLPELFTKLFTLNTDEVTIVLGPTRSDRVLSVRAVLRGRGSDEEVVIENVELKKVSGGEKQAVLSNGHQDIFFQIKIIFDFTHNEPPNTYKAEVKIEISRTDDNIKTQLLMDRFFAIANKGAQFHLENTDTNFPMYQTAFIKLNEVPDDPRWIPILEALLSIQTATQTSLSVPKSLSNDEIKLILNLAYVIKHGKGSGDVKCSMDIKTENIHNLLDKNPIVEFSTFSEEQNTLQGKAFSLGLTWINARPIVSADERNRLREELRKYPQRDSHLVHLATIPEQPAQTYYFDFLSFDDFEALHDDPRYRKIALEDLIDSVFDASMNEEQEQADVDVLLACFESAANQTNVYGEPYNMLRRARPDELNAAFEKHFKKLSGVGVDLLFRKLVDLKIITDDEITRLKTTS